MINIKNSYSLVVCGDSISKGVIYDSERLRYATLKESFVNIVAESIKGTVYNAGRFGSTIIRGVSKMYNDIVNNTPDIVLIEFGGNDCDFNWDAVANDPNIDHKPNTDMPTFRKTLLDMISTLKNSDILPVLMTLPPLDPKKYFKWIAKGDPASERNILHWLGSEERIFTWHNSYNEMIVDIASETKTLLIDVRAEFLKYSDYSRFLCTDGIHPNVDGHSLIANVFLNFMRENLKFLLHE
jgi:lysophospholipase L1-like esterase